MALPSMELTASTWALLIRHGKDFPFYLPCMQETTIHLVAYGFKSKQASILTEWPVLLKHLC